MENSKELEMLTAKMGNVSAPQFPGQMRNDRAIDINAVRSIIRREKKSKGFKFGITQGTLQHNINLSGTARMLLGFMMYWTEQGQELNVTMKINNEVVIDQVNEIFFDQNNNSGLGYEYFFYPRPLSGQDNIILETVSTAVGDLYVHVFYI